MYRHILDTSGAIGCRLCVDHLFSLHGSEHLWFCVCLVGFLGRKAMPSGVDQSQSLEGISSFASSPFTLFSSFSSSPQDTLHTQRPFSSSVHQPLFSSPSTSRGRTKNAGVNAHPTTSQGPVFPGCGVCIPQAILVNRGSKQWTLPTCEDLDDETFTLTYVFFLP